MRRLLVILGAGGLLWAGETQFELSGRILPEHPARVYLQGAVTPFTAFTYADTRGRFRFRRLQAGTYTLAVFVRSMGETRRTIEVGPSLADEKRRVAITVEIDEAKLELPPGTMRRRRAIVSTRELSISERAWKEYLEAQKKLSRRDIQQAIVHLERAVEIAPHFSVAWNNLGTIAYQSRRFSDAERYFRRSLEEDPVAFEPLVNLGGVLLTLGKLDEALDYNLQSVLARPNDALANSQLGMTYFAVGNLDLAEKYCEIARRLDPAHFSHPQLTLAEIHLRRNQRAQAADELEEFVRLHPDWPQAASLRGAIAKLRNN